MKKLILITLFLASLHAQVGVKKELLNAQLKLLIDLPYLNEDSKENKLFNKAVSSYAKSVVSNFMQDPLANKSLDISFDVLRLSPFYSVRLNVLKTQASGYNTLKVFHLYKGKMLEFKDLFAKGYAKIAQNIKKQMKLRMKGGKSYFLNFVLKDDQSFYFKNGYLVVAFDEYAAGPGYMGVVEFVIPKSLTKEVLKPEFTKL